MELVADVIRRAKEAAAEAAEKIVQSWANAEMPREFSIGSPDGEALFASVWALWIQQNPLTALISDDQDRVLMAFRVTFFKALIFSAADEVSRRRIV